MNFWTRLKIASSVLTGGGGSAGSSSTLADIIRGRDGDGRGRAPSAMLSAYAELPWLHAVVGKVSLSVASTPWRLYRPTGRSQGRAREMVGREVRRGDPLARGKAIKALKAQGEIEEVEGHRVLDLLYEGNDFMTGSTVRQLTQAYQDVVGEAFLLCERDGVGEPRAFLPIPRSWVKKIATPDDPTYDIGFEGFDETFDASDVIYFQQPDLRNPYGRGVGTAQTLSDELDTDEFAARYTKQWFANDAKPPLLVYGKGMSKEETLRLERKWNDKFQGIKNAFKPAFLSGDISVQELNQSFQSMQLKELRSFERDTIIQVYGVPPEILGIIENSNRATIEAADYLFSKWVVQPRMEYNCEVLQVRLVDEEFDDGLILGYESPVAEDKAHRLETAKAAPWALMVDEWREMMGLEPLAGNQGQVFMMPFNLVPQSSPALAPDIPDKPAPEEEPEGEPEGDEEPSEQEGRGKSIGRVALPPGGDEGTTSDVEEDYWFEELNREDLGRANQHDYDNSNGLGRRSTVKDENERSALTEEDILLIVAALSAAGLTEAFTPLFLEAITAFGERAVGEVDPDGEFEVNPRVTNYLSTQAAEKIRDINEVTRSALRDDLVAGVRAGEGIPALKARVENVFEQARGWRANTIARTEVVGASNFGSLEGYKQGGVPGKEWLETADDDTRDAHEESGGQRVGIDEDFENSLGRGPAPGQMSGGAANNANCRCTILPVLDSEQDSVEGEMRKAMWRAFDRERMPFERRIKAAARKEFGVQRDQVLELVEEHARERAVV